MTSATDCILCREDGGQVLVQTPQWRIVLATEADATAFPGFTRVIWQAHDREMTDLSLDEQVALMGLVFSVEALMLTHLAPSKINLASLGNQVDHLHWHIIPRWREDSHFPRPIWATPTPGVAAYKLGEDQLQSYCDALVQHFSERKADRPSA